MHGYQAVNAEVHLRNPCSLPNRMKLPVPVMSFGWRAFLAHVLEPGRQVWAEKLLGCARARPRSPRRASVPSRPACTATTTRGRCSWWRTKARHGLANLPDWLGIPLAGLVALIHRGVLGDPP